MRDWDLEKEEGVLPPDALKQSLVVSASQDTSSVVVASFDLSDKGFTTGSSIRPGVKGWVCGWEGVMKHTKFTILTISNVVDDSIPAITTVNIVLCGSADSISLSASNE